MDIKEYKKTLKQPLNKATLAYLVKENLVLLAMKKRGFGMGKWNGIGGKLKSGEDIKEAAAREIKEEVNVKPIEMKKVAVIDFYHPDNPTWNQQVTVFEVNSWDGDPEETEEMAPQWFKQEKIPYDLMWPDDKYWFPLVLKGKIIRGEFMFSKDGKLVDHTVKEK